MAAQVIDEQRERRGQQPRVRIEEQAAANPRFREFRISRTAGSSRRTTSTVASVEALSTTTRSSTPTRSEASTERTQSTMCRALP
jgi:hypothetical protein